MADIETEKMKCVSNERLAELADIYTRAYWASDALSPKAAQTVEDVGIVVQELQQLRVRVCETCEASYGHNRPYAPSYVQCNQIWDAVAEDHQEVEKTHYCGLWEAKESKDE